MSSALRGPVYPAYKITGSKVFHRKALVKKFAKFTEQSRCFVNLDKFSRRAL